MALGATSGRILRAFLGQGLRLAAIGIAIGAAASVLIARLMLGALAGLSPADPLAFGAAIAVLVTVGLAATYLPARHAASLSPVEALRVE